MNPVLLLYVYDLHMVLSSVAVGVKFYIILTQRCKWSSFHSSMISVSSFIPFRKALHTYSIDLNFSDANAMSFKAAPALYSTDRALYFTSTKPSQKNVFRPQLPFHGLIYRKTANMETIRKQAEGDTVSLKHKRNTQCKTITTKFDRIPFIVG